MERCTRSACPRSVSARRARLYQAINIFTITTRSRSMMRKAMSLAAMAICCGLVWGSGRWPAVATLTAQSGGAALYDWTTDGGDNQRTGWNKSEKTLTKENVKNLKLLWKLHTDNPVRALHALMPVLVIGQLSTPSGTKQVGYVTGISDNLYAFEVETGKILWQKHWDYPAP